MPMAAEDIITLIKQGIPDAEVEIQDLAGDGDHYAATVVSPAFAGKSKIQQHQMVYGALGGRMGGVLHALKLTPWRRSPDGPIFEIKSLGVSDMSDVFDRIRDEIGKNDVLLFMKGTPVFPQCGFSAAVVDVLSQLGVKFHGINILTDGDLRQGIKEFSQW